MSTFLSGTVPLVSPEGRDTTRHWVASSRAEPPPAKEDLAQRDVQFYVTAQCGASFFGGAVHDPDLWAPSCSACAEIDPGKGVHYVHVGEVVSSREQHYGFYHAVTTDLVACDRCSAVVVDDPESRDTHTDWHARTSTRG